MTDLERAVWGAAFAAEHAAGVAARRSKDKLPPISGIYCAEIADEALDLFREAMDGPARRFIIPAQEGETSGD